MALPRSVQEEGKKADEMIRQLHEQGQPSGQLDLDLAPSGTDTAPQPTDPAAGTEVQPDSAGVEHNWKDRFSGLQKTHANTTAELRQARQLVADREAKLNDQAKRIAQLEQDFASLQRQHSTPDLSVLSEDDLTMLGEDNAVAFAKMAENAVEKRLQERLEAERKRREAEEAEAHKQAEADRQRSQFLEDFKARLKSQVPEFDKVDNDPGFNAWIQEIDPITQRSRTELLSGATWNGDVGRAASFYKEYVDQTRSDPRENLVQPQPAGESTSMPLNEGKKIWTRAEISHFYNHTKPQLNKRDPARAAAIDADIIAAAGEGRVR
jgi:uncharacterized protein YnzC (UPF0291/DUF896 family)